MSRLRSPRLRAVLALTLAVSFGCTTTTQFKEKRVVQVVTQPPGATLHITDSAGRRAWNAPSPTGVASPYTRTVQETSWWWMVGWLVGGAALAATGGALVASAPEDGKSVPGYVLLAGGGLTAYLGGMLGGVVAGAGNSDEITTLPGSYTLDVSLPGYLPQTREVKEPLKTPDTLFFTLERDPNHVASPPKSASGPRVVAVFPVQAAASTGLEGDATDQLTDYITAKLAQSGKYRVVPRDQLKKALSAQKLESYQACYDQSCQIELGKAVAAEISLSVSILRLGQTCAVTGTVYDLRSDTAEQGSVVRAECAVDALAGAMDQVAEQLARGEAR
jgi:hypothetical protein